MSTSVKVAHLLQWLLEIKIEINISKLVSSNIPFCLSIVVVSKMRKLEKILLISNVFLWSYFCLIIACIKTAFLKTKNSSESSKS